jgi:hypothetical protein
MEGCSDMPYAVVIDVVFASLVECAVFVGVADGEIEMQCLPH